MSNSNNLTIRLNLMRVEMYITPANVLEFDTGLRTCDDGIGSSLRIITFILPASMMVVNHDLPPLINTCQ